MIYCVFWTALHETLWSVRSSYYSHKISVIHPQAINEFVSLILDQRLFTLCAHLDRGPAEEGGSGPFDAIPPQNDKSVLSLQNVEPILRVIWLAITTDSTRKEARARR